MSRSEVRQWEKREIQISSFFWASENSWLQSYTDCKTTTLWPESLRDAFYVIRFYSNRDERPFMLNFAIEYSSWVEKRSCIDHLRLKRQNHVAVGNDHWYGCQMDWYCVCQGIIFLICSEWLGYQSTSADRTMYNFLGPLINQGQIVKNHSLFHMAYLKSSGRLHWYSWVQRWTYVKLIFWLRR